MQLEIYIAWQLTYLSVAMVAELSNLYLSNYDWLQVYTHAKNKGSASAFDIATSSHQETIEQHENVQTHAEYALLQEL